MKRSDRRLIEDFLPIDEISRISVKEKQGRGKGHPTELHQWWARRPLAASRAAVYAALVPSREGGTEKKHADGAYFESICHKDFSDAEIEKAAARIREANGGEPPVVLDLFAGGGAIPLEAQRLGCETIAGEVNPVAHLIQKLELEYAPGQGDRLAKALRHWGAKWVDAAWERVGHLYPVPDSMLDSVPETLESSALGVRPGDSRLPLVYLWTRTVACPNATGGFGKHSVPILRQSWLGKRAGSDHRSSLRPEVAAGKLTWRVVHDPPESLDFDPSAVGGGGGGTTCRICGAAVSLDYIKEEGLARRMGEDLLAAVVNHRDGTGKDFLEPSAVPPIDTEACAEVLNALGTPPPSGELETRDTLNIKVPLYGFKDFSSLFTARQLATLCTLSDGIAAIHAQVLKAEGDEFARHVATAFAITLDRLIDRNSAFARWDNSRNTVTNSIDEKAIKMLWDFAESNPFSSGGANLLSYIEQNAVILEALGERVTKKGRAVRASATKLPLEDASVDAVITDPPYYDAVSYADLSDFYYVWLKRSIGFLYPEDLASEKTPKKNEAIAAPYRAGDGLTGSAAKAAGGQRYEELMAEAFSEARRVLKDDGIMVCVYAHKTTAGWGTLIEALRKAGFRITEAWPVETEMPGNIKGKGQAKASLASSIFLVARAGTESATGEAAAVRAEAARIIEKRLSELSALGISGADLSIAVIGAALQAFTKYETVEHPNGSEMTAADFIDSAQRETAAATLRELYGLESATTEALDGPSRYYVMFRHSYGYSTVDFDEATNLAKSIGVEIDDLSTMAAPMVERKGRAGDLNPLSFEARGETIADQGATNAIDGLHGLLWLNENNAGRVPDFLAESSVKPELIKAAAEALKGRGLVDAAAEKSAEQLACERLLSAWKTVVETGKQEQLT